MSKNEGLTHFATGNFGYYEESEGYISRCHLYLGIRKRPAQEELQELSPEEFYPKQE